MERPMKLSIDLEAKARDEEDYARYVLFSDEEMTQRAKDQAEVEAGQQKEKAKDNQRQADLKAVREAAKNDPYYAALARAAGIPLDG